MIHFGLVGAVLHAKDLQRLAEFYAAVTGIELRHVDDGFSVLGVKQSELVIVRIPKHIADSITIESPPVRRDAAPVKLVFAIEDIAAARRRAVERGGAVKPVEDEWMFEGVKVCDGHDPEGNVFQLRASS